MSESEKNSDFEMRRQLLQMEMLYEIGVAINGSLDPTYVGEEILQRALVMIDARAAALLVREEAEGKVEVVAQIGLDGDPAAIMEMDEVVNAWSDGELVHVERASEAWKYLCVVPLESRQEVKGILIVADRERRGGEVGPFSENDEALLHSFAYQAGSALQNARLHRNLEEAYRQLQIAQRKLAQLEQLRALGDLAADVVHTIAHIMGIIIGRADMYLNFPRDPAKTIRSILETAESGQEIIERIRHCTRLGVGRKRVSLDFNQLIGEGMEEVQVLWGEWMKGAEKPVEWVLELADLPATYANPTDMKEVVENLLLNALEAMPEGGRIEVSSSLEEERIAIAVRDTGTGMSEEVKKNLFQPFYTTKEEIGTGLGLSIVYRVIDDHGGELEVESREGEGCCFTIYLPVCVQPPETGEEEDVSTGLDR